MEVPGMERPRRRGAALLVLVVLSLASGCTASGTMATVPAEWRQTNPWSPTAWEARCRGDLKPLFYTDEMADQQTWAQQNLQAGDLLFRRGISIRPRDRLNDFIQTGISDSAYNHTAIVCCQAGEVWVYDVQPDPERVRKLPFEFWMLETMPDTLVVKRLRPEYRCHIPQALAFCEAAWQRQPPFDWGLRLDDERFYCTEMIEKAFRSSGLALSQPVPPRCLPNSARFRALFGLTELATEIRMDEPVFAPGNVSYGLAGSPYLERVHGDYGQEHRRKPVCMPEPAQPCECPPG